MEVHLYCHYIDSDSLVLVLDRVCMRQHQDFDICLCVTQNVFMERPLR